jgi:hypothetical protein
LLSNPVIVIKMTILYATAYPNELTKGVRNDYYLLPKVRGTLYTLDIIRRLESKQIATNNVNGEAFVLLFFEECLLAVKEGYSVVTPLFRMYAGIHGTVTAEELGHNIPRDKAEVRINFRASNEARDVMDDVHVHAAEQPAATGPVIQAICNPLKKEPDTLNRGSMVLISGLRLAVRGELTDDLGVFFTQNDGETEVRIPANQMSPNSPSKLQFVLPAGVTAGEWRVSVATQGTSTASYSTKQVRRYEYQYIVTVI